MLGGGLLGVDGIGGGCRGEDEQNGQQRDELAQPARTAPYRGVFPGLGSQAGVEELAFPPGQRGIIAGRPVSGQGEAGTAVEDARIAVQRFPRAGRFGELAVQALPLPVLGQPVAQARPAADERFVGDLDAVPVEREQPAAGQVLQDEGDVRVGDVQLASCDAPFGVLGALTRHRQAEEQVPRDALLMRVQRGVQGLGRPRECVVDAAGGLESGQGQGVSPAPSPGLHQGVGQQRQYAHLAEGVGHQGGQQGALDRVTGADSGLDDGLTQLVGAHRPDHDLSVAQRLDQVRVARAVRVEVGPDAQHHPATTVLRPRGGQQRVDEPGALGLLGAEGEDLLELVHHQHQLGLAGIVGQCLADQPMQVARVGDEFGM